MVMRRKISYLGKNPHEIRKELQRKSFLEKHEIKQKEKTNR